MNVIAIMDSYGFVCGDPASEISQARAAVAELIEATKAEYAATDAYNEARSGAPRNEAWAALLAARTRRLAALAKVSP